MAKQKESKFAETLREWGFTQTTCSVAMMKVRSEKGSKKAFFMNNGVQTNVHDETGQCWIGPPTANLVPLGFEKIPAV